MNLPYALLVDDHKLYCQAVSKHIQNFEIFSEVHFAQNYLDSITKLRNTSYKIAFLDIEINEVDKNGFDIAIWIKKNTPDTKIMMLSQYDSKYYVKQFNSLDLDGYFLKIADFENLKVAIDIIFSGQKYIHPEIKETLERVIMEENKSIKNTLSDREIGIIEQLATDKSLACIALTLHLELSTLNSHIHRIKFKTNTQTRVGFVWFAIENCIINPAK